MFSLSDIHNIALITLHVIRYTVYVLLCVTKHVHVLASYPGSSWRGERRTWYALLAHASHLPQLSGVPDIYRARPYYDDIRVAVVMQMTHCVYIIITCMYMYVRVPCMCVIIIHAYRSPRGLYVIIKRIRQQCVPGSLFPVPTRAWVRG